MFGVEVFDVFDWDMLGAPLHFLAAEALAFSLLTLALQYLSAHVAILSDCRPRRGRGRATRGGVMEAGPRLGLMRAEARRAAREAEEAQELEDETLPMIVMRDRKTKSYGATMIPEKGDNIDTKSV